MLYIMTRLDHVVIHIKDLIPDVVGLGGLVSLELLFKSPSGLLLLPELLSVGVAPPALHLVPARTLASLDVTLV